MLRLNYIKERRVYARHIQNRVMAILIILIIIGIIIVVSMVKTCNKVRVMKVKIDEAQSDIESYLIKRYDVLTESVKAIGDFKEYEQGIMENIIKPHLNMTKDELKETMDSQDKAINQIMALNVPEITSSELYVKFQEQLSEENSHVAASKRMYNANVSTYNQYIVKFPVSLFGYSKIDFLNDETIGQKKDVNIKW